ncbi:hypothetical protein RCZ04_05870 [Capnocytophaga sp. HP1101]
MNSGKSIEELAQEYISYAKILEKVANSAVFIVDKHGRYYYLSEVFDFPDVHPDSLHPEDREVVKQIDAQIWAFLETLPAQERLQYKHIYEFRVLDKGKYMRVIYQLQLLAVQTDNWLAMGFMDISPEQSAEQPVRFQMINCLTDEIVPLRLTPPTDVQLTPREKEVLLLANEGMFSKEISERLHISVHTVNRHRQNILEKTHTGNILEAVAFAKRMGLMN